MFLQNYEINGVLENLLVYFELKHLIYCLINFRSYLRIIKLK